MEPKQLISRAEQANDLLNALIAKTAGLPTEQRAAFSADIAQLRGVIADMQPAACPKTDSAYLEQIEQALRQSDARLHRVALAVNEGLYEWATVDGHIWVNDVYEQLYGAPADNATDPDWWTNHLHLADRQRVLNSFNHVLYSRLDRWVCEYRFRREDGSYAQVLDRAMIARDAQGKPVRVTGAMFDLTDLKETELALRKSEERFQIALANAPIAVFTTDKDLRYTWIYSPWFGETAVKMLGKRDDEILLPEEARELIALKTAVLQYGTPARQEIHIDTAYYQNTFIVSLAPARDNAGEVTGLVGSALDISEQRRLEARHVEYTASMEVHHRLLEQREMERLQIARMLHDGPVQGLNGLIFTTQLAKDLLHENAVPTGEVVRLLNQVMQDAGGIVDEMRGMCNDLRPPSLRRFGLIKAIHSHAVDFQREHTGLQLQLNLTVEDDRLPYNTCLALYRIYQESMTNAARHAQASLISVKLACDPFHLFLEVADNGRGFEVSSDWVNLARLGYFGLVGMKERAEIIGGTLSVGSKPHEGTVVQVVVPWH